MLVLQNVHIYEHLTIGYFIHIPMGASESLKILQNTT